MSTVVKGFSGAQNSILLKGAPERVIQKCETYKNANGVIGKFSAEDKESLIKGCQAFASKGLRCLALAAIYDGGKLADLTEQNVE